MTARADRLTKRAKTAEQTSSVRSSYPASSVHVFVDALERLGCRIEPLLASAGIGRADLDDPDGRVPSTVWGSIFRRALEQRPMKNAGMRLATVTPIGAFPLIDYLIATSQNVGEGLARLARYQRLAEARSVPCLREEEDPIRVVLEGRDSPISAEFTVTLNLLHFREETEGRFRASYASHEGWRAMTEDAVPKELRTVDHSARHAPLAMDAVTFRELGHRLVDQLAEFLDSLPRRPVTHDESPSAIRDALDLSGPLPESGTDPGPLLEQTAQLLFDHSLFNGHPRFFGYITAAPAPIGILADFLAAAAEPERGRVGAGTGCH